MMSDLERVARAIWEALDFASTYDKDLETAENENGIAANRILVAHSVARAAIAAMSAPAALETKEPE